MSRYPATPNEKIGEMLFTSYALRLRNPGEITLYAPSTREEFKEGYDAQFTEHSECFELYIQFKRVYRSGNDDLSIKISSKQLHRLQLYPNRSAYYVAPTFLDRGDVQAKQRTITNVDRFLDQFIAINAYHLPHNAKTVTFSCNPGRWDIANPRVLGGLRRSISVGEWMRGGDLFRRFLAQSVGHPVRFSDDGSENKPFPDNNIIPFSQQQQFTTILNTLTRRESNLGVMMRLC